MLMISIVKVGFVLALKFLAFWVSGKDITAGNGTRVCLPWESVKMGPDIGS